MRLIEKVRFGLCMMCQERKRVSLYFAPLEPRYGLCYDDVIEFKDGVIKHPWPRNGKFIWVCDECKVVSVGLQKKWISDYSVRCLQKEYNVDVEKAKEQWKQYELEKIELKKQKPYKSGWSFCCVCKSKKYCLPYFAPLDPKYGLCYEDAVLNPNTGNINFPWPEWGKWVFVCDECKKIAIGLQEYRPRSESGKVLNNIIVSRQIQKKFKIDIEKAKQQWQQDRIKYKEEKSKLS